MKLSVAVFFGGKSTEHEISCISANQVINALDKEKYDVYPIYISKSGDLYTGDKLFDIGNYDSIVTNPDNYLNKITLYKDGNKVIATSVKGLIKKSCAIDVAFPVVHGTNVEDGTLAGYLQMLDLPYTSCDVLGASIGQDKAVMKSVFKAEGIPMVDYFVVFASDFDDNYAEYLNKANSIGFPLIAKPANLGSSIGIEIIKNKDEFKDKIKHCLEYDFKVVVEKVIDNLKEVNISVIGSIEKVEVSVIEEVTNGFLDYDKKYKGGGKGSKKMPSKSQSKGMASTNRKIPADITSKQKEKIEQIAVDVFKVLNAHGCVRIDFMIDKDNNKVYCNEINTIPGSLAFYLWKEVGVDFDKECDILIKNALRRYNNRQKKTYSFDTNILKDYAKK